MLSSNLEVKNLEKKEIRIRYLMGTISKTLAYLVSLMEGKTYTPRIMNFEFEWPVGTNYDIRLNKKNEMNYKLVYLIEGNVDENLVIQNAQGSIDSFVSFGNNSDLNQEKSYFLSPKVDFVNLFIGPSNQVTLEYAKSTLEGIKSVSSDFIISDPKYSYIMDFLDFATDYLTSEEYTYLNGETVDNDTIMSLAHIFASQKLQVEKILTRTRHK